jgi:transposase-like protein
VKVKGVWKYVYRAVDKAGATVDFLLTAKRDCRLWCKLSNSVVNPDLRSVHGVLVH